MKPRVKIGLLALTIATAGMVWLVGGSILFVMLRQHAQIETDAQRIFDVSSAKVFEATRTIRGLERLAREGDAIPRIADAPAREERRLRLQSLLDDAVLQGEPELRGLVSQGFETLDKNLAIVSSTQKQGQQLAAANWAPVMQALLNKSEAVGAEVSELAAQEADDILSSAQAARQMLVTVAWSLGAVSLVLFGFVYMGLTRPLVRLSRGLLNARQGKPIRHGNEIVSELQMLQEAALALSEAHNQLELARRQLEKQAYTDALTGLANRRMFELQGDQLFEQAIRYGEPLSVIVFDIDHFKRINDQHGHEGGDIVLRALGGYLKTVLRSSDGTVARVGGEEFALLIVKLDAIATLPTAQRLREGIEQLEVVMPTGETLRFSVSVGVAQVRADDDGLSTLLRRADLALYQAKKNGRNRVEWTIE